MIPVFADTSFFIALVFQNDQAHGAAVEFLQQNQEPFLTTSAVILELGGYMSRAARRSAFRRCLELIDTTGIETVHVDADLQAQAIELFERRQDKEWSLVDCISFLTMEQQGMSRAATTDRHFREANLQVLLPIAN